MKDLRVEIIKALEGVINCPDCKSEDCYEVARNVWGNEVRCNNCGIHFILE